MLWHAMPPELNTARLMAGAGAGPMLQAAEGWQALALALETQAAELASSLGALSGAWTGMGSERAVSATMPMVAWLQTVAMQAQKRAMQAAAQAAAYTTAMATTPPLEEIEQNHITHAVLEATNFLGINTVPIGINEADYFIRMWNQAAGAMDAYQAETVLNTLFEPIAPMTPIVIPGVGEAALGASLGRIAASAPGAVARDAVFAHVTGQATAESAGLQGGRGADLVDQAATDAEGPASQAAGQAQTAASQQEQQQAPQQATQQATQMMSQLGSQVAQIPQQLGQIPQQMGQMGSPMQQLTQPLQQVTSLFSQMGGHGGQGMQGAQMGLIGASPLSNHPLAGGSGASAGAGLMRAAALPGAGGSAPRTPLLAKLVDRVEHPVTPAAVAPAAAAGSSTTGGVAPVGAGSGGMGPMGMMGHAPTTGGSKAGLVAPAPLAQDLGDDEDDDW
ncbi:PPE family protein [Mycobacterium sp. SM1]|uniref:PPE family protein n=1 Tax=Mycobacterium sp. SM1 TaxID=2816243 RepID=UPI001BCB914B|nr:PPE family protein [Mycobacterium sp. SM1]